MQGFLYEQESGRCNSIEMQVVLTLEYQAECQRLSVANAELQASLGRFEHYGREEWRRFAKLDVAQAKCISWEDRFAVQEACEWAVAEATIPLVDGQRVV